jgi:hypothetical protein
MSRAVTFLACVLLTGCASLSTEPRPLDYYGTVNQASGNEASLFGSDEAVLSDADIARILEYRYTAPPLSRIALLPIGLNAWSAWSEEMAVSAAAVDAQVVATLRESPRIYDASFLPSILVPDRRTVPYLREAAARYQADLLLMFRSGCRSFERYRIVGSDQARAYCAVEAVVLDVRTGLVPFVTTSTQNYEVAETETDLNFRETMLRSQLNAIATSLKEIATAVVVFIERPDDSPSAP